MSKTVWKGDTSLQYTILPQTEQLFGKNALPQQPPDTHGPNIQQFRIFCYISAIICFGIFVAFSLSLIDILHRSDVARKLTPDEYNALIKSYNDKSTTTNSMDVKQAEIIFTNNAIDINSNNIQTTTENSIVTKIFETPPDVDDNAPEIMDTITDYTSPESKLMLGGIGISSPPSKDAKVFDNSEMPVTVLPSTTIDASSSSTASKPKTTALNYLLSNIMSPTNISKRAKMPRVTLKLRENDTIPKMYMKAGIASYKKGNITTSVLAHGLSLEGLIFKTPEGTIKPWNRKSCFSQSDFDPDMTDYCGITARLFILGLMLGAITTMIGTIFVIKQVTISPVKPPNVEEPLLNPKDDAENGDRSKLLEPETKLINEKE